MSPSLLTTRCTKPGMRPPMSTCWLSWSASACSSTPEKTRGRSCVSSLCLPPSAAARSPTSTIACRRSACDSSWRCTLWPGNLSSSRARQTVCSSPWNESRRDLIPFCQRKHSCVFKPSVRG